MGRLRFPAPQIVHTDGLRAELAAAGLTVDRVLFVPVAAKTSADVDARGKEIYPAQTVDEIHVVTTATRAQVAPVVQAHTGTPPAVEQRATAAAAESETATDGLRQYRAKMRQVVAGQAQFTVAERDAILARLGLRALRERPE